MFEGVFHLKPTEGRFVQSSKAGVYMAQEKTQMKVSLHKICSARSVNRLSYFAFTMLPFFEKF